MRFLIVGSGIAGITLAEELHKLRPQAEVTVLSRETNGYYSRPMLSHGFARDDVETKIVLKSLSELSRSGIELVAGVEVLTIHREAKTVDYRQNGQSCTLGYDKLALAPGSDALIPPGFRGATDLFHVINSLDDLVALRRLREQILKTRGQACWAVIGGGLIGCEVSSDLAKAGDRVVLYHALPRLMERQLVEEDSASLLKVLADHGIEVKFDSSVQGFEKANGGYAVKLADGSAGVFDGIIVACGFKPRTELAAASGLPVNRGILVDGHLCTADPHIFALGDAAECSDSRIYAYVMPIRHQAAWLANHLAGTATGRWEPPDFKPRAKVHGFVAAHPYLT